MASHPKFDLKRSSNDKYYFNLTAANGQVILSSEMYNSKDGAENGIQSVKENSREGGQFEKQESDNGQHYFTLKAKNHQEIGRSEMYTSTSARDNGIESVIKNGGIAEIEDNA
jgi:hypothetical protein